MDLHVVSLPNRQEVPRPSMTTSLWAEVSLHVSLFFENADRNAPGTAGCVLASRLSEDPDVTVLLVEAGGRYAAV